MAPYRDTPVIMLTAMTDMDHLDRAFLAGASDYTTKPFDIVDFGQRLQAAKAQVAARRAKAALEVGALCGPRLRDGVRDWDATRLASRARVATLINPDALESYLMRLSGRGLTDAYVVAVVIDAAPGLDTWLGLSAKAAQSIAGVVGVEGYMMSSPEPGVVVLVATGAALPDVRVIEAQVQARLARATGNLGATVTVGLPVRAGGDKPDRARAAFARAILLANDRAATRQGSGGGSVHPFRR